MENSDVKTPIWFWLVAALFTFWNFIGVYDFTNSIRLNETYLMALGPEIGQAMIAFLEAMPLWAKAVWGLAIGTAMLACLSLFMRKTWAIPLFIISFLAMFMSFVYQLFLSEVTMPKTSPIANVFTVILFVVALIEIWFSRRMKSRGVLK